jgi:hypothetical protein
MEIIICAAIRMSDGYIVRGHRHNNCIRTASEIPKYQGEKWHGDDQGFITSTGRYVDRKEAFEIASKANQLKYDLSRATTKELYSEDLY